MPRKKVAKREPQSCLESCVGCGGSASGYNYDAPSCNSCKTFFRRTVLQKLEFTRCYRLGLCGSHDFIRQCRACRFDKCIKGGMNPARIDNSANNKDSDGSRESEEELQLVQNPSRMENQLEKMMMNLLAIEEAFQKLRTSTYYTRLSAELSIDDFLLGPSRLGVHFEPMPSQPYHPSSAQIYPMEMIIKHRKVMDLSNFDYSKKKLWGFQDIVNSVEFIKALPVYHLIDDRSRRVLLSSALDCANLITAYYSYSHGSDRTYFPDGCALTWSREMQAEAPGSTRFHTALIAAIREADCDVREYTLLKMIVVCNPMLDGLLPYDASLLHGAKERFTKTLFSYVLARRGVDTGPAFFAKLLSIVNVLIHLTSWEKAQHALAFAMGLMKIVCPFTESIFLTQ